jgi:hypothetical protein
MNLITLIIVIVFIVMEVLNVLTLYFSPGAKTANSAGIFKAWEKSKNDPEVHDMVKYLVYWVAGTKVIFISLLIVVIIFGDFLTQNISIIALIISIATFYWKLFPLIIKMDKNDQLRPKGYSKVLGFMISGMIIALIVGLILNIYLP